MPSPWPPVPPYEAWSATCDTLHAHTQVLGKLAVALAPPEPQLQHAALRLTARGWETAPLPAPDGSGAVVVALDLRAHEAVAEHTDGGARRVALTPDRAVREVTREALEAVRDLAGPVEIDPTPQEVTWTVPLDEDAEHARYDPREVAPYFAAATRAALVLAAFRAPGVPPCVRGMRVGPGARRHGRGHAAADRLTGRQPSPSGVAPGPGGGGVECQPCTLRHRRSSSSCWGTASTCEKSSRADARAPGPVLGLVASRSWLSGRASYGARLTGVGSKASYIGVASASLIESGLSPRISSIVRRTETWS